MLCFHNTIVPVYTHIKRKIAKPYYVNIYSTMKKTRHKFHYTVRRLKRNKTQLDNKIKVGRKIE